jgi:hypothetical protein
MTRRFDDAPIVKRIKEKREAGWLIFHPLSPAYLLGKPTTMPITIPSPLKVGS